MSVINLPNKKNKRKITRIKPKEKYDTPTPVWSGGVVQRNGKMKWSDLVRSND